MTRPPIGHVLQIERLLQSTQLPLIDSEIGDKRKNRETNAVS